ncbi:MAG: AAA family ATPase [Phycisphaerae bacterium]|nr:AAA family ATPase [Phycisphaerae bacterium]
MTQDLQTYLRDPDREANGYTSLLRQAMAEILHLSASVVEPLESEIESEYQRARSDAKERFDRDKEAAERELRLKSQTSREEYETLVKEADAEFEGRLSAVKIEVQQRRKRVMQTAADLESKAEKEKQDQLLVAEFVAEGAATKKQQKSFEAKATAEQTRRRLDDLDAQANLLIRQYRCRAMSLAQKGGPLVDNGENPAETLRSQQTLAEQRLDQLHRLRVAQLFAGARPVLLAGGLLGVAGTVLGILHLQEVSLTVAAPAVLALTIAVIVVGGHMLWHRSRSQVRRLYEEFQAALMNARIAFGRLSAQALDEIEREWQTSVEQKQAEIKRIHSTFETTKANIAKQQAISLHQVEDQREEVLNSLRTTRDRVIEEAQHKLEEQQAALERRCQESLAGIQRRYDEEIAACEDKYQTARKALEDRWDRGLARIDALLQHMARLDRRAAGDWEHLLGESWTPSQTPPSGARFAAIQVDLGCLADSVAARAGARLDAARFAALPALLEFPSHCSLLLEYPREGRPQAIDALRAVMMRLFASFPPGQARFTIFDPVGLGESFAGFMHAGDYLESLVGGRIWTEALQFQEQLEDLTQHMENVIQKYLRNEFETIEQYNRQAGELAEPYRFLVIADFPRNFSEETARRLSSVIHSGPRCGVHTLIAYDTRAELPSGVDVRDIHAASVHLVYEDGRFVWRDDILKQFPLVLDEPPGEEALTEAMHAIGKAGAASARVEVPFTAIAPEAGQLWSLDSRHELRIPLGRTGATRLQQLVLGRGVAQHMLIAGKTGSGKSTLLHVMVTNLALWYSPDQVELYLIDFKQGVEFKTYATHHLPHARAIAIESDREFGLSILRRLDAEMTHRGDLFRQAGVQDLAAYRKATGKAMPRTVLIVDEFQVFFAEDDKLAQDAAVLLEQLVRQGRAFGIHVVLGSQTLGGVFGLARSTIGQMAIRIALQCSDADAQLILDDDNMAARLLSRPGEAIYNDAGGRLAGNSPFQTAWLPDATRDDYLAKISSLASGPAAPGWGKNTPEGGGATVAQPPSAGERTPPRAGVPLPSSDTGDQTRETIVFEGSAPADIRENRQLAACLGRPVPCDSPRIWLGAPVTIKEPTAVTVRRQSGANVLIVGQRDDLARNLISAALVSLAAQCPPGEKGRSGLYSSTKSRSSISLKNGSDESLDAQRGFEGEKSNQEIFPPQSRPDLPFSPSCRFIILDGSPPDAPGAGVFERIAAAIPHECRNVGWHDVADAIAELANEVDRRMTRSASSNGRDPSEKGWSGASLVPGPSSRGPAAPGWGKNTPEGGGATGTQPPSAGERTCSPAAPGWGKTPPRAGVPQTSDAFVFLVIFGLQRYRMLRRNEDAFSFSRDEQARPQPDVQFADLLREGPSVGVHTLAWANTLSTLERTLDRQTIHEFDHRVLFQMSAADSSNLIDSPIANQLGLHRALLHSEEQGGIERFRPYDAIRDDWLADVGRKLPQGWAGPKA